MATKKGGGGGGGGEESKAVKAEKLRRITVKTVCGMDKGELLKLVMSDEKMAFPLMRVGGIATGMRPGDGDFGPYVRFIGQFQAINIRDGRVFAAAMCLLPKFLEDELAGALGQEGAKTVEFGFEISVKYDKSAATSYVFLSDSLLAPVSDEANARIAKLLGVKTAPALTDKSK